MTFGLSEDSMGQNMDKGHKHRNNQSIIINHKNPEVLNKIATLQPNAGLIFTCSQADMKYHSASLGMTHSLHVGSPAVVGFLDQDYR